MAILLGLLFRHFLYIPLIMQAMSAHLNRFWHDPLNMSELLKLLTLVVPGIHADQIDPQIWTLVLEMHISLFFPLSIFCLLRRWKITGDFLILAAVCFACLFLHERTMRWVPLFVLGAVGAPHFDRILTALRKSNPVAQILWLGVSLVLLETVSMPARDPLANGYAGCLCQQRVGLGAAGIILGSVSFTVLAALSFRHPRFNFSARLPTVFI